MKCSVCGLESDVIAEGKCVSCYEKSLIGEGENGGEPAPIMNEAPTAAPAEAAPMNRVVRSRLALLDPATSQSAPVSPHKKRSILKYAVKYGVLSVISLAIGGAGAYVQLFVLDTEEPDGSFLQAKFGQQQTVSTPVAVTPEKPEKAEEHEESVSEAEDEDVGTKATEDGETASCDAQDAEGRARDSDCDGILDYIEERIGTDPEVADSDSDGLSDGEEVRDYKTRPLTKDSDSDGYRDGLEVEEGTDPNDPASSPTLMPAVEHPVDRQNGDSA